MNNNLLNRFKRFPFHLIGFAAFPVLSLYAANASKLRFSDIISTLLVNITAALLLWLILKTILKDAEKSAVIISISFVFFFSFGLLPVLISIIGSQGGEDFATAFITMGIFETWWGNFLLILSLSLFGYGLVRLLFYVHQHSNFTPFMNILGFVLLLTVAISFPRQPMQESSARFTSDPAGQAWLSELDSSTLPAKVVGDDPPDIYIIILDGYTRHDILLDVYGYDNSDFLSHLEEQGFYIARNSHANYGVTSFSIGSLLNYSYLDGFSTKLPENYSDLKPLLTVISDNRTFRQLRNLGYKLVCYPNGYTFTNLDNADQTVRLPLPLTDFGQTLLNNTPLAIFSAQQYAFHRERIIYSLDQLPKLAKDPEPTIAFVHILAPHPPFVFNENGEPINPPRKYSIRDASDFLIVGSKDEYREGYRQQINYLNRLVLAAVDQILTDSPQEPIILLQGDHGAGLGYNYASLDKTNPQERFSILNAYLLPQGGNANLYPSITPVNSLRIIFNTYFGTLYPLLEDRSYYQSRDAIQKQVDITDKLNP